MLEAVAPLGIEGAALPIFDVSGHALKRGPRDGGPFLFNPALVLRASNRTRDGFDESDEQARAIPGYRQATDTAGGRPNPIVAIPGFVRRSKYGRSLSPTR